MQDLCVLLAWGLMIWVVVEWKGFVMVFEWVMVLKCCEWKGLVMFFLLAGSIEIGLLLLPVSHSF